MISDLHGSPVGLQVSTHTHTRVPKGPKPMGMGVGYGAGTAGTMGTAGSHVYLPQITM